jgi:signal transduction histidine kinase
LRHVVTILLTLLVPVFGAAQVIRGNIDLSAHDFSEGDPAYLAGEWEFFWNKLLTPELSRTTTADNFIHVPGSWHRQGDYSPLGYATYRMKMKLPDDQAGLSIYFPIINASAKIWINGKLVESSGKVSDDPATYKPRLLATLVAIPEGIKDVELIVQVANFNYFSGGIAGGWPELNKSSAIFAKVNRRHGIENFFAGSLIALCIYQLILYFLYHRGKPFLWLALICLGVALRALIVHGGSFLLPNLLPDVSWEIWKKLEFGSIYAIVALFPLYVFHLFRDHAPVKPLYFFIGIAVLLCGVLIVTPQYVYGRLLELCHLGLLLSFIYAIYSISRAWRAGNDDARIILFGVLASFPFILAEILKNSRLFPVRINFIYLVEMGVLVFLLFQVYLLAHHYAKSYKNLAEMNQNLERLVEERSGELITANAVKDRLLSVMSHDIKSPLNSLRGILQIYNQGAVTKEEFNEFAQHIETDLSKTSVLVENILYWTASQLRGIQVNKESFDLRALVEENITLFKTISALKKITVENHIEHSLIVHADRNIVNLVLRNLLSNAIKFSFQGGVIRIDEKLDEKQLMIQVIDEGVGMDEDTLETLLAPELVVSAAGTGNEKGTGLGLALCKEYLESTGGTLIVDSEKGKGSMFSITLPLSEQIAT